MRNGIARAGLALLGVGFALVAVWLLRDRLIPAAPSVPVPTITAEADCQPAPGAWLAQARALLGDYREPCAAFYWMPEPTDEYHNRIRLNNYGLHAPDYVTPKPRGVFRLLIVGDSFPQGLQVTSAETFPNQMTALLTERLGRPVEVINLSVDAYGTDRELLMYALLGHLFQPDAVLLAFYAGNDVQDNQIDLETRRYGYRLGRPFFTLDSDTLRLHNSPTFEAALYPDSPAFAWLAALQAGQTAPPPENLPERPRVVRREPLYELEYPVELGVYLPEDGGWREAWALTGALLAEFHRLVTQVEGLPFGVVVIPDRRAVQDDDWTATVAVFGDLLPVLREADPAAPGQRAMDMLKALDIPALDLTPALRTALIPGQRLYYLVDGHFNTDGHAAAARTIAEWAARLGWF